MKRILLVSQLLIFLLAANISQAMPAHPGPLDYTQPDGSTLTMFLKGDEYVHWAETTDGYTLLHNKEGYYVYAIKNEDGYLIPSPIIAHQPGERNAKELAFLNQVEKGLKYNTKQIKEALEYFKNPSSKGVKGFPTTGVNDLIMILANFDDTSPMFTQTDFDNYMNQNNYNGTGSFKDYYLECSYGQLTMNTTVTIWVDVPNNHDYYGPQSNWGEFAYDAVVAADNQANTDFSQYDNDGDGTVDGIAIIHQGRGQESSGNPNDIWSHSWNLSAAGYSAAQRTFDGVLVDAYTTQPEKRSTSSIATIGVMCHEFGHNLGAPDFYDTDYSTGGSYTGTGSWDMMAGGSWNGYPSGSSPAHHNVFTKWYYYGWLTPTEITSTQTITLNNIEENQESFFYTTPTNNEYWLLENRQQTGFDQALPGHGLIIYHVDENYIASHGWSNDINATHPQGMYPVCASANADPPNYGNINSSGCPFPGSYNVTTFTDETLPSSNDWDGNPTGKPITNISENSGVITFDISISNLSNPQNFSAIAASTTQIDLSWDLNPDNDDVLLAFNEEPTFGTPQNGTTYSPGDQISGGGLVLYAGNNTVHSHEGLEPETMYYYKIWADNGSEYSAGTIASATTLCDPLIEFPFEENFSAYNLPDCWQNIDNTGTGEVWQFDNPGNVAFYSSTVFNGFAVLDSDNYGSGGNQNADLISPSFDFSDESAVSISFEHYYKDYNNETATLSYSTNGGDTWIDIQSWSGEDTENPEEFYQDMSDILAGEFNVMFKWNYTGSSGYHWAIDDISISTGVGIDEKNTDENVVLSPNPVDDYLRVSLKKFGEEAIHLEIYNATGQKVKSFTFPAKMEQAIDLSDLNKGIYFVKLYGNSFSKNEKIIVK